MSSATSKHRSGVADTVMRSVASSATCVLLAADAVVSGPSGSGRRSASHLGECLGQPRSEACVVEACHHPLAGCASHPAAQGLVGEQAPEGRDHLLWVGCAPDDESGLLVPCC